MSSYTVSKQEPELFAVLQYGNWAGRNVRVGHGSRTYVIQKPRTNAPNPFSMTRVRVPVPPKDTVGSDSSFASTSIGNGRFDYYRTLASNKAYGKLVYEVTDVRASLALTMVDRKKTFAMIASRLGQILRVARALNRYDYAGAFKAAGLNPERGVQHVKDQRGYKGNRITGVDKTNPVTKARRKARKGGNRAKNHAGDTANAWLELQFGVLPLVEDIQKSIKVLSNTPPATTCVGRGRVNFELNNVFIDSTYPKVKLVGQVGVRHQLRVRCTNPNLLLLHELGLDNPAHVFYDAVPLSFVLDWFVPVGKYLQSWTDFTGLEVLDAFTTTFWNVTDSGPNAYTPSYRRESRAVQVSRTLGVPSFKIPRGIQYTHGLWKQATETALIAQKLIPVLDKLDRKIKLGR